MRTLHIGIDLGGTTTRVGVFDQTWQLTKQWDFASADHAGLLEIIDKTELSVFPEISSWGVAVAGPVTQGRAQLTNLPWAVDQAALSRAVGHNVVVANDLVAHGHGLLHCPNESLVVLQEGEEAPDENKALIAAGTGLGECLLVCVDGVHHPVPSEGSHSDFGAQTDEDIALLKILRKTYDHVSWERAVSGKDGFRHLLQLHAPDSGPWRELCGCPLPGRTDPPERRDVGAQVVGAALQGDVVALRVVEHFCRLYGAEAGNLALKGLARGGVYVSGGIAQKIMPFLQGGAFMEGFCRKGRFRSLMQAIPVAVVTDPLLGLRGAARLGFTGANRETFPKS